VAFCGGLNILLCHNVFNVKHPLAAVDAGSRPGDDAKQAPEGGRFRIFPKSGLPRT
jgi:hypothetical protein